MDRAEDLKISRPFAPGCELIIILEVQPEGVVDLPPVRGVNLREFQVRVMQLGDAGAVVVAEDALPQPLPFEPRLCFLEEGVVGIALARFMLGNRRHDVQGHCLVMRGNDAVHWPPIRTQALMLRTVACSRHGACDAGDDAGAVVGAGDGCTVCDGSGAGDGGAVTGAGADVTGAEGSGARLGAGAALAGDAGSGAADGVLEEPGTVPAGRLPRSAARTGCSPDAALAVGCGLAGATVAAGCGDRRTAGTVRARGGGDGGGDVGDEAGGPAATWCVPGGVPCPARSVVATVAPTAMTSATADGTARAAHWFAISGLLRG